MNQRTYLQLPINTDEGFPQSFRLNFNGRTYQFLLYVNVLEDAGARPDQDDIYTLPDQGAFLVMRVLQENVAGATLIFQRKLVTNLEYEAAEVGFIFKKMRVARRNLNGVGSFGSQIIGGITALWAS